MRETCGACQGSPGPLAPWGDVAAHGAGSKSTYAGERSILAAAAAGASGYPRQEIQGGGCEADETFGVRI